MTTEAVISCDNVTKTYTQGKSSLLVLQNLQLNVARGESVAIIGSSGSGKTTLLNLLGGLDDPDQGEICIVGKPFFEMNESKRARWRNNHLGFVYQFHHLLGEFSALENVAMPLLIGKAGHREASDRAGYLLEKVGLAERLSHRPHELSGGERQRVAIARSLASHPDCVLMDEPTGNLDPDTSNQVLQLLVDLNRELATSFVIVTHDHSIARRMERVLELRDGCLQEKHFD